MGAHTHTLGTRTQCTPIREAVKLVVFPFHDSQLFPCVTTRGGLPGLRKGHLLCQAFPETEVHLYQKRMELHLWALAAADVKNSHICRLEEPLLPGQLATARSALHLPALLSLSLCGG